jgi:hypothetical protein
MWEFRSLYIAILAPIQPRQPSHTFGVADPSTQGGRHQSKVISEHRDLIPSSPHCFGVAGPVILAPCLLATLRPQMMAEMMAETMTSVRSRCMKIKLGPKLIIR